MRSRVAEIDGDLMDFSFGIFTIQPQSVVGHAERNILIEFGLKFNMQDDFGWFEKYYRVGANWFDCEFGLFDFGQGDEAINVTKTIREDIRRNTQEEQKFYLAIVESTYRKLADLLLKQDRILEAQQLLDLLKVE